MEPNRLWILDGLGRDELTAPYEAAEENITAESIETDRIAEKILLMFKKNRMSLVAVVALTLLISMALFAPFISPHQPNEVNLDETLLSPSLNYPFGTDHLGRCVLSRIIHGSRISLAVGFIPTIITLTVGVILGLISGFFGGKVDFVIMRFTDLVMSLPGFLITLLIVYVFEPSFMLLFIAMSIMGWPGTARIIRSQTLSFKEKEFVEAARSVGVSRVKIMIKHVLPNCLPTLVVMFTLGAPGMILTESGLSFLGVGIRPPDASWGTLINQLRQFIFQIPISALAPGLFILLTVMAFNFLGDGLRDAIDPYMKE